MTNENQKGGRLDDDSLNEETLASSDSIVKRGGSFGNEVGLQQHFTPEPVAKFIAAVLGKDRDVFDPTAGDGSLLQGFAKQHRFGVEIDKSQARRGEYHAVKGDIQHVFPLLENLKGRWPVVVCNPPFGLKWSSPAYLDGREVSSTQLGFHFAHKLTSRRGWGVLICPKSRFENEIEPAHSDKFFAVFEVSDLWEDVAVECVVAFYVYQVQRTYNSPVNPVRLRQSVSSRSLDPSNLPLIDDVKQAAKQFNPYAGQRFYGEADNDTLRSYCNAAQTEYDRRLGRRLGGRKSRYDLSVQGGLVHYAPTPYARLNLERASRHERLVSLSRQSVNWFAFNKREWALILDIEREVEGFTICPRMKTVVQDVIDAALEAKVPLYEMTAQQRLGFLVDEDLIECIKSDPEKGYEAGNKYPITCSDAEFIETETNRQVKSPEGGVDLKSFKVKHKYLRIQISAGGYHSWSFGETKEEIEYLCEHFKVPDPGTVETRWPERVAHFRKLLDEIEAEQKGVWPVDDPDRGRVKGEPAPWSFFPFQKSDLSRGAVKDRLILSWEQGGGKTLAAYAWIEMMKRDGKQPKALIIVPGDLVDQTRNEFIRFGGWDAAPEVIGSWERAREVAESLNNGGSGVFICHYELLSRTGACAVPLPSDWHGPLFEREVNGEVQTGTISLMGREHVKAHKDYEWDEEGNYVSVDVPAELHFTTAATNCPQCGADYDASWRPPTNSRPGLCDPHKVAFHKDGKRYIRDKMGCGYKHVGNPKQTKGNLHHLRKPAGSILSTAFRGGILIIDELTKMKGDSDISRAVRAIQCDCVLGLSGTPIKNYIGDAYWPMWKVIGNNSPRFPYKYGAGHQFAMDFSVVEAEIKDDGKRGAFKPTAKVTNLMKLWALFGGCYIRRRKEEMGVELVPKTFYPTVVPLGVAQHRQSETWLKKFGTFFENENPEHRIVKAGMQHFLAPLLGLHWKLEFASTLPEVDPDRDYWSIDVSNWTPKNVKTLEIAMHHAAKGDRILIGSDLVRTAEFLSAELEKRGVTVETMLDFKEDGPPKTKAAKKRGSIVREFQTGDAQVLCASIGAMAYGHNLDRGSVVILQGLPWDYAGLDQFLARVHRLTSEKPVSVYVILAQGTIDEKKWKLLIEKGDGASLALDGRLIEQDVAEISKEDVIRELMESGIPLQGNEVPETEIEAKWAGIKSVADLGSFVQPEAQDVLNKKAEQTDATTFDAPAQRDGYETVELTEFHTTEVVTPTVEEADGGELRDGEVSEAVHGTATVEPEVEAAEEAPAEESEEERGAEEPVVVTAPEIRVVDIDTRLAEMEEQIASMPESSAVHEIESDLIDLDDAPDEPAEEPKEREVVAVGAGEQSFFDFDF